MKTKNILSLMFGIILLIAMTAFASASVNSYLYDANNQNANTITITQGTAFNVETVAVGTNGENFVSEKLELVGGSVIFSLTQAGIYQGSGVYSYSDTHTVNSAGFAPGTYTLRFTAKGSLGGTDYADLTLIVNALDSNAPIVTISNPANGNTYTTVQSLDYTAVDNEGNLQDCRFSLDGGTTWSAWTACSNSFGVQTPQTGSNTWTIESRDTYGNIGSASTTFTYNPTDIYAPSITISSPLNGNTYNTQITQIDYTPTDFEGNLNNCWYSLDGGTTTSFPVNCNDGVLNSFTGLTSIEGLNTWIVYADDTYGNVASKTISFTVDTIAPVITAVSPINGEDLSDANVILKVTLSETATVEYVLNGEPKVTMSLTTPLTYESAQLTLEEDKTHTVTYTATDAAGNIATLTISFTINDESSSKDGNKKSIDSYFDTKFKDQFNLNPSIDLTGDEPIQKLTWWQRFVNWLCRLFGLKEYY